MNPQKPLLNQEQMRTEILASHARSAQYGVCRLKRSPDQTKLTPAALETRRAEKKEFLDLTAEYIDEIYEMLPPDLFIIAVVDSDGYILQVSGSDAIRALFEERNCSPGYRFTEREVGTTAIGLCLRIQVPIQLNDKDHYCQQAHRFTSSASPIFDPGGELMGILVVSGRSDLVHPHTLIMVASAARSIERQNHLLQQNKAMSEFTGLLSGVLESAETGVLVLGNDQRIWKTNRRARQILKQENLEGRPFAVLKGWQIDLERVYRDPASLKGKECWLQVEDQLIHLAYSAQPILSDQDRRLGAVLVFEKVGTIRKLADKISGGKAYFTFDHLVGEAPNFKKALDIAKRVAKSNSTVLLTGETGTGKELFAQAIHNASPLRDNPFVPINCGAIPGELIESELFGYADGAFSGAMKGGRPGKFELARGGTILLDEIGDLPLQLQVKLLRVLQTGEIQPIGKDSVVKVDTRIIASTNANLLEAIEQNHFRKDLYYRINIITITIPPLRDRGPDDIMALAQYFIKKYNPRFRLAPDALDALSAYNWPGNVRELENTIQRAIQLNKNGTIRAEDLNVKQSPAAAIPLPQGSLQEMEKMMVTATLRRTHFNMAEAAKILNISRATLYRKVKTYQIEKTTGDDERSAVSAATPT
jgi:transcriptional regulator of acetoin/glycerol metabolism